MHFIVTGITPASFHLFSPYERIAYVNFLYNFHFLPSESVQKLNKEHLFFFSPIDIMLICRYTFFSLAFHLKCEHVHLSIDGRHLFLFPSRN